MCARDIVERMAPHQGKVIVDSSRWPVVVISQVVAQLTDEERLSSLAEADALMEGRTGRYAVVLDNRLAGPLSPTQRSLVAEYGKRSAERVRIRCVGTAMVVSSEVMRMMVTAIQWQTGKMSETQVFDDLDAGTRWASERLAQATNVG